MVALVLVLGLAACTGSAARPDTAPDPRWRAGVESWVTDLRTDQRLAARPRLSWQAGAGRPGRTITVDPTRRYQQMAGFGASMTDSSAYLLSKRLSAKTRKATMAALFSNRAGIGLSMLRQPMGASDFAVDQAYSYDDQPAGQTDPDLSEFSIGHDRAYILPRLREARRLNPELRFMASPWSAPGWMKDTGSMVTGSLLPHHQQTYAEYFARFIRAYRDAGIPTHYLTVQNEPLYEPADYPGMELLPEQAGSFIAGNLAPTLRRDGLEGTAILGYDHNWDIPDYPEALHGTPAVAAELAGTAWHCYAGEVTDQTVSHNDYPHAPAYQTECSGGEWQGSKAEAFGLTMGLVIGAPRNWGQSVMLWNLALDRRNGPYIGGCTTCRGVVTVHPDGTVTKNLDYWALGHASRFVRPGAVRIGSTQPMGSPLQNVAFENPDGSTVLIVANRGSTAAGYDLQVGDHHARATLAAGAAATYRWRSPAVTPAGDLGWVDLDLGDGPAGTPSGRLVQTVGPDVIAALRQVRLGDRWLAYSLPYGSELRPAGPSTNLPRRDWVLSSEGTEEVAGQPLANLTDGKPETRWSSGTGQRAGMSLTLDLGRPTTFTEIEVDAASSLGDYLRRYVVQVSDDRARWTDVARGPGRTGAMTIPLPSTTARYLRLVSDASATSWWSIHELNLRTGDSTTPPAGPAPDLRTAAGALPDGTQVQGAYNAGAGPAEVTWAVPGLGYRYLLAPAAAVTFAVLDHPVEESPPPTEPDPPDRGHG